MKLMKENKHRKQELKDEPKRRQRNARKAENKSKQVRERKCRMEN